MTGTGSHMTGTGSDVTGTGSGWKCEGHVFCGGKPLTSCKKIDRGLRMEKKPLRNVGSKSKVQFSHRGRSLTQRKDAMLEKRVF